MRSFALTYPQLMNQAIAAGLDVEELARLRTAYEVATALADGVYRPHGQPFLCHLVRTASIVLAEGHPAAVVQAALTHAAYGLWAGRGHGTRRSRLCARLGHDVEELVFAYDQLAWNSAARIGRHVEGFAAYDRLGRRAVAIRVANELEDHLDRAAAYASPAHARRRRAWRDACLALARLACSPALVAELEEAFDGQLDPPLPAAVVVGRDQGFRLRGATRWFDLSRLRRGTRALLRGMRAGSR